MRTAHKKEGKYPVLCAWCPKYGRVPRVLRMSDQEGSHGICSECREMLMEEAAVCQRENSRFEDLEIEKRERIFIYNRGRKKHAKKTNVGKRKDGE